MKVEGSAEEAETGEGHPESGEPGGAAPEEESPTSAPAVPGPPEKPTAPIEQPQATSAASVEVEVKVEEEEKPVVPSPMLSERDDGAETPSTPDSAFDPNRLSLEQFRVLIENFLGNEPNNVIFKQLAAFFRTAYFETEEERKDRLLQVQTLFSSYFNSSFSIWLILFCFFAAAGQ